MHPIENIMQTSVEQIKNMVDVTTVVGDPIMTENKTMVLPVSKLCLGFLVGGGEYGNMASAKKAADEAFAGGRFPFAGASTVGMSIKPLAFVAVEDGNVRVLPAEEKSKADRLMDIIPHIAKGIDKLIEAGIECLKTKKDCSCSHSGLKNSFSGGTADAFSESGRNAGASSESGKTANASAEDVNAHECGKAEENAAWNTAYNTASYESSEEEPADSEF